MAKQGGMGSTAYVDGYDVGGDTTALGSIRGGPAAGDVTSIKKSAMERIGLKRDGAIEWTSAFNPDNVSTIKGAHQVLKTLPTADRLVTYFHGQAIGSPAASCVSKQVNYDATLGQDGSLFFAVSAQGNGFGTEWGEQLTVGSRVDTTATNGAALDYGAVSTLFGWSAYIHLTEFTGTSVTITVQDSADNASFLALTDGATGALTGIGGVRLTSSSSTATVRRYLRVATTGTFTRAVFSVNFIRYATARQL
jgi:hypothetical protein